MFLYNQPSFLSCSDFFSGSVIGQCCFILLWNWQKDFFFFTFGSFQSQTVSNCATEAFRFLCSHLRKRLQAGLGQNQSLLCWHEVVKQKIMNNIGGLAKFSVIRSSKDMAMKIILYEIGKSYYEGIMNRPRSVCSSGSTDRGFVQLYFGCSHFMTLSFQWVCREIGEKDRESLFHMRK